MFWFPIPASDRRSIALMVAGVACFSMGVPGFTLLTFMGMIDGDTTNYAWYVMLALVYLGVLLMVVPSKYNKRHLLALLHVVIFTLVVGIVYANFIPQMREMAEEFEENEPDAAASGGLRPTTGTVAHYRNSLVSVLIINAGLMAVLGALFAITWKRSKGHNGWEDPREV